MNHFLRDAVLSISNSDDITTWVSEALPGSEGTYVCKDATFSNLEELPWKNTNKTYTLTELNDLIYDLSFEIQASNSFFGISSDP